MKPITFELLDGGDSACAGGKCPSVYLGSDGFVYVKGNIVDGTVRTSLSADSDEDIVQIPMAVFQAGRNDSKK